MQHTGFDWAAPANARAAGGASLPAFFKPEVFAGGAEDAADEDDDGTGGVGGVGRREKHKLVEQRRREKTKELLVELQQLLPRPIDKNATMNTVLNETVKYLRDLRERTMLVRQVAASQPPTPPLASTIAARLRALDPQAAYRPCFLSQKLGIAYAAVDGSFLDCNSMFASNLGFPSAKEVIGLTIFNISTPEDGQQMSQLLHALVHCDPSAAPSPSCVPVVQHCVRPDSSLTPLLSLEISLLPRAPLPPVFMICIRPHQLPPDAKSSHPLPSISAHASSAAAGGVAVQHSSQLQMSLPQQQAAQASAALAHFAQAAGGGGLSSGNPLQLSSAFTAGSPQLSNMESGAGFFNFDHLS